MSDGTVFIYSAKPGMNQQFMTLFKAVKELESREFGTKEFRESLFHLLGLMHFQFGYEEDLMKDYHFPGTEEHRHRHRLLNRELQGLLDLTDHHNPGPLSTEMAFLAAFKAHCREEDNLLIEHINGMPGTQTIRLADKARKISDEFEEAGDQG